MRRTSSRRRISLYPSKNGRCSQIAKNSQIGLSRHLDSSTTTQVATIIFQYGRPSRFLLNEICMVILWQDCHGKGKVRRSFLKYGWEKVPNWECLFVHREKGLFLSVYVDDIKLAGKKQNINPTWKILLKDVDFKCRTQVRTERARAVRHETQHSTCAAVSVKTSVVSSFPLNILGCSFVGVLRLRYVPPDRWQLSFSSVPEYVTRGNVVLLCTSSPWYVWRHVPTCGVFWTRWPVLMAVLFHFEQYAGLLP